MIPSAAGNFERESTRALTPPHVFPHQETFAPSLFQSDIVQKVMDVVKRQSGRAEYLEV